jgi:spore germination protein GerM
LFVAAGVGVIAHRLGLLDRQALEQVGVPGLRSVASREVTLYFGDPRWTRLVAENRKLQTRGDAAETIQALVQALAEGPRGEGAPVLPRGARLRGAYLGRDGLAVIDFEPDLAAFAPGGAGGELLTVFALVHTISENVNGIRSVQILVGGEERETLAGHVKISEPLGRHAELETEPQE